MVETAIKLPVRNEPKTTGVAAQGWYPFGSLKRQIDRLFDDLDMGFWGSPLRRSAFDVTPFGRYETWAGVPIDVAEKDGEYEITCELPGMDEKDIEVKFSNGTLMIRGTKKEMKEETKKDYFLSERRYGSFERSFVVPEGVDFDKISATFNKGVLTVVLPKTVAAQKQEKKIAIKAAA
jgi:HSP20 family protein